MTNVYIITADYESSDFGGSTMYTACIAACRHRRRAEEIKLSTENEERARLADDPEGFLGQSVFKSCDIVEMTIDEAS